MLLNWNKFMKKQKEIEMNVSSFFVERIKERYGLNYKIKPNEDENKIDGDTDIYMESLDNKLICNLQLTTGDMNVYPRVAYMNKQYKKGNSVVVLADLSFKKCIENALKNKEKFDDKESIILIIHSEYSSEINKDYGCNVSSEFVDSKFKGIFWVLMPNSKDSTNKHNGQIIAIKNSFGENGISF
jgi:hypothetical protein